MQTQTTPKYKVTLTTSSGQVTVLFFASRTGISAAIADFTGQQMSLYGRCGPCLVEYA